MMIQITSKTNNTSKINKTNYCYTQNTSSDDEQEQQIDYNPNDDYQFNASDVNDPNNSIKASIFKHNDKKRMKLSRISHVDFTAYSIEHLIRNKGALSNCYKRHLAIAMSKDKYNPEDMKSMSKVQTGYFPLGILLLQAHFAMTNYNNTSNTTKGTMNIFTSNANNTSIENKTTDAILKAHKEAMFVYSQFAMVLKPEMLHDELIAVLNDQHINYQQVAKELEMRLKAIQSSADSLITNNYFPFAPKVCPKFYYFEYCADQKSGKCELLHICLTCKAKHTFTNCPNVEHNDRFMQTRIQNMNRKNRRQPRGRGYRYYNNYRGGRGRDYRGPYQQPPHNKSENNPPPATSASGK